VSLCAPGDAWDRAGAACSGGATETGGRRRRRTAGAALWWSGVARKRPGSFNLMRCGEARGELNWGREGSGVGVPRRAGAAAGGDRRRPSIGQCDALGKQLRVRRASLSHKESSYRVVVVWG
jgi:hypothetical protein